MIVYILFHETNTGHSDESDGYVEAIYTTREQAELGYRTAIKRALANGADVYYDPETGDESVHWSHDWRVEEWTVKETFQVSDLGEDY